MLPTMNIGETIRNYRLQKGMSQGDIEKRTGLLRCYLSRVENGHTIPSLDTLSKIAGAMEPPLSQFFNESGHTNGNGFWLWSRKWPPTRSSSLKVSDFGSLPLVTRRYLLGLGKSSYTSIRR